MISLPGSLAGTQVVVGSVVSASIALRTRLFWTQVMEKIAECFVAASTTASENPAESTRIQSWQRGQASLGITATNSVTKLARFLLGLALPPLARRAKTSPGSPTI